MGGFGHPLFAASDEGTAGLVLISGLIGGAVAWAANWWTGRTAIRRKEYQEDEATAITRLESLCKRLDADRLEAKREAAEQRQTDRIEIHMLRNEAHAAKILATRAVTWIRHLEERLISKGEQFERWQDTPASSPQIAGDGSGPHAALPEAPQ